MNAATLASALGGRKAGAGWAARCPAHDDRLPSLSIRDAHDGRLLIHCHAGCDQRQVIAVLRTRGLWAANEACRFRRSARHPVIERPPEQNAAQRSEIALATWQSSIPANGTLAHTYLASRGLHLLPPPTLRFCAGLKHGSGGTWPAMVALVAQGDDGTPLAIHRTFLARDGRGKAPVDPAKMMLGPCRGGAVRLADPGDVLMVGEGIETCLAAMQATGQPAWAALSTSGLRTLDLPASVRDVIILADGDDPGEAAARDGALRWMQEGRRVRIARPPRGMDFNDVLMGRAPGMEQSAR